MRRIIGLSAILVIALATGCPNREVAKVDPNPVKEGFKDIPVNLNRDIDILFVIDNSGSMAEEQASLANNFQRFINVLETIEGGLPNVNIGVVSSDTGSNAAGAGGCTANGDNGVLQSTRGDGAPAGCPTPTGAFIQDWDDGSGGRIRNYDTAATLADTFSCIARLGTGGCGFEQHLESMRRALNGSVAANANFLSRENAYLAIIIIADEDDCSTADAGMFDMSSMTVSDPLGPLSSFRCFEYGIDCDVGNDDRRAIGPRQDCYPRVDSPFMYHPDEYATFVRGLKDDPSSIIVAGIIGNVVETVNVVPNEGDNNPELAPSCGTGSAEAAPGIRLQHFLNSFPQRNSVTAICNEDLSDALVVIANLLAEVIGNPCIEGNIDTDPDTAGVQYECQVSDVRFPGADNQEETPLPECDATMSNIPCWNLVLDVDADPPTTCDTDTHLVLVVERGGASVPTGTHTQVRCVVL
jgi:hypothetical protein